MNRESRITKIKQNYLSHEWARLLVAVATAVREGSDPVAALEAEATLMATEKEDANETKRSQRTLQSNGK